MNGEIPIFNIKEEQESLFLQQVDELVGGKSLLFAASVSYVDIEDSVFESVFVSAHDDLGSIYYYAALVQRSYLNMKQIQVGEQVWEIPADAWSVYWTAEDGIVFSSDDVKICSIRCEDEEILYELIVQCEDIAYEQLVAEITPGEQSELAEPIAMVEVPEVDAEPELVTIEEWLNQQYSVMSVDQIIANIDEWSVEMLRETYQYELLGRSRPKVLSKIIEYLGFVGEDPRNTVSVNSAIDAEDFAQGAPLVAQQENIDVVSFEWESDDFGALYRIERTSDRGKTWTSLCTTTKTTFSDHGRTKNTTDIYRISVSDGDGYFSIEGIYSPLKPQMENEEISQLLMPYRGEISQQVQKQNAKVLKDDRGTLQVHCPYCGTFTEKTIYSNKKFNRAIDNTNRANELKRKAQKRQRQAEKFIAMGDRLSFTASGAMRANQIDTNHMIQDQLGGKLSESFAHLKNNAEVECKNCGELVDEI